MKLYVDGVDVTAVVNGEDSSSLAFPNETFYIGGRNMKGSFVGDVDSMKIWSRALTKAEVTASYNLGPGGSVSLTTTGRPVNLPCSQMSPAYGVTSCVKGEEVDFSAVCDLKGVVITGWNVYTNATGALERMLMISGSGTAGSFICPNVACNLEWLFDVPTRPAVYFLSPLVPSTATVSFSCGCLNGAVEQVRVLALSGGSPTSLTTTNELGVVSSPSSLHGSIPGTPYTEVMCVKLIAVDQSGKVVASSPIKVTQAPAADVGLVAWWPFGDHGLQDASENGYGLEKGSGVTVGEFASFTGTPEGNDQSFLSAGGIAFENMNAVTVESWVRWPNAPTWWQSLFELSADYNQNPGAFVCYYENSASWKCIMSAMRNTGVYPNGYARVSVGGDCGPETAGEWHHLVAVYPKGAYDLMRIYVDGVDVTRADASLHDDMTSASFVHEKFWIGGRDGKGTFNGDMDSMQIWSRVLTANDIDLHYRQGRDGDPRLLIDGVLVEPPDSCPADQVFPPTGLTAGYALGESVSFVADWPEARKFDYVLSTNAAKSAEWIRWRCGSGASGSFAHPGVPVKVSWRRRRGFYLSIY